jgi:F0F1-type ATP synthase membrane subunit c/vacuolar-type H+-ATPase subunit K
MKTFRLVWMLLVGLAAVIVGLGRHVIADALSIPRPPGQYVMIGLAVALAGLAIAPMYMFRRG